MVDVMSEMRKRVEDGEDAESVRREMIVKGYPIDDVERAAKAFDWRAEKREFDESGRPEAYREILKSTSHRELFGRMGALSACIILLIVMFLIFGLNPFFLLSAICVVVIMALILSGTRKRGIH